MKKFRNLYFPNSETTLPQHMAEQSNTFFAGAGTYQLHKLIAALPYVKTFHHAVDVGANVGTWSRVLARMFAHVTCFEPVQELRECLALNIASADLEHVTIHGAALGARDGMAKLSVQSASSGWTHIQPTKGGNLHGAIDRVEDVEVRRLDSFGLEKIDFMKIDCEGFEDFVVQGGLSTIQRDKPVIIVEQKPGNAERYGLERIASVKRLGRLGAIEAWEISGDYCMVWK